MNESVNENSIPVCNQRVEENEPWKTYVEIAKEDEPFLTSLRSNMKESSMQIIERIDGYIAYCTTYYQSNGDRPTKFQPNEHYDLHRFSYKNTMLELLKNKTETNRMLIYISGGAFIHTLTDNGMILMQRYADAIGDMNCISMSTRVQPDNSVLDTIEDVLHCYQWVLSQGYDPNHIIIMGDSSGANISLAFAMYLRDHNLPMPRGLVLFSAFLNFEQNTPSYTNNVTKDCVVGYNGLYDRIIKAVLKNQTLKDPYVSLLNHDFSNLPDILVQVSTDEIDLDDNVAIAQKCNECGTKAYIEIYHNLYHDFQSLSPDLATTKFSIQRVKQFVNNII